MFERDGGTMRDLDNWLWDKGKKSERWLRRKANVSIKENSGRGADIVTEREQKMLFF